MQNFVKVVFGRLEQEGGAAQRRFPDKQAVDGPAVHERGWRELVGIQTLFGKETRGLVHLSDQL